MGSPLGWGGSGGTPAASTSPGDTGAAPKVPPGPDSAPAPGRLSRAQGRVFLRETLGQARDSPASWRAQGGSGVPVCPRVSLRVCQPACLPLHRGMRRHPNSPTGGNGPDPVWGKSPQCRALPLCTDPDVPGWTWGAWGMGPQRMASPGVPRWQGLAEPPWCSSGAQWPCAGASASPRGLEMVLCPPKPHSALPALPSGGSGGGIHPPPPIQPRAGEWAAAFAGAGGSCRHRQMLSSLGHMAGAWQQRELWPPEEPGPPWGIWGNGGRGGGLQRV